MSSLVTYFDKYKCDKGSAKHRYDRVYEPALQHLRDEEFTMLEIGIFKGVSIEAWVEYFSKATIMGIDTFERVDQEDLPILKHPRVTSLKCDSTLMPEIGPQVKFDVIVDDGLHTFAAQRKTFENFFPHLSDNGVYFIEDVWPFHLMTPVEKHHKWLVKHVSDWNEKEYALLQEAIAPYKVVCHDLRAGHDPDTCIIEVRK